ncbi:MAG: glycosyltransferase [Magnetococcales bacterium]|nr:glycosyltransferase [Magnetococcales bacterium]
MVKQLLFVMPNLAGGGAERGLILLCNALVKRDYRVTIFCFHDKMAYPGLLDPQVKVVAILSDGKPVGFRIIRVLRALLREARQNDLVIGGLEGWPTVVALVAARLANKPVISWIHCDVIQYSRHWSSLLCVLFRWSFRWVDGNVCLSQGGVDSLKSFCRNKVSTIQLIYSFLEDAIVDRRASNEVPIILGCGRLIDSKGFDLLIRAYARLRSEGINSRLVLMGEGLDRAKLAALVSNLGVEDSVSMPGFDAEIDKYYSHADLFVHPSRMEGFPRVVLEAMRQGLPVVATDCPSGPGELLEGGYCGELVSCDDVEALVSAMRNMLLHPTLRRMYADRGRRRSEDFTPEKILPEWEALVKYYCN